MKTGKGAGAPSRRTRRTGEKTAAKKKRGTAARMPRSPKTEAERLRDAAAALAYLKDAPMHLVFTSSSMSRSGAPSLRFHPFRVSLPSN